MADDAHPVEALPQQADAGKRVVLHILRRAMDEVACGLAKAPVVVSQRRYPVAGQCIGNHRKRLVLIDFLVPVLEAAAGDHNQYRRLAAISLRQYQRPFQHSVSIGEGDLLLSVRERPFRCLRPVELFFTRRKCQGQRSSHLFECPRNLLD